MKKTHRVVLPFLGLLLSSCSLYTLFGSTSRSEPTPYSEGGNSESLTEIDNPEGLTKTKMRQTYVDFTANNIYPIDSCPTQGSIKLLVIPVWFTDSKSFVATSKKEQLRDDIATAYFGTEKETGWHSVKSFYETESEGCLSIDGVVSEWYECGIRSSKLYTDEYSEKTSEFVEGAVEWYFSSNPSVDRKSFDSDSDGYLDGVMMIYACPDYSILPGLTSEDQTNMWAYCFWVQDTNLQNVRKPGVNTFFWASYDFMYSPSKALQRTGYSYGSGDTRYAAIDAHTYIHEMGHVFGLDDYYDYGDKGYAPAGCFSMQDMNVGGHDPYSVMAFGWADPYIPTESCTISIRPFQVNHDLILLTPSWNSCDSPFDEYLLLELYTPSGLNAFDSTHQYGKKYPVGPNAAGIRLWHVDARMIGVNDSTYGGDPVYKTQNITFDCFGKYVYGVVQGFNNSYESDAFPSPLGSRYESFDLLHLIKADASAPLHDGDALTKYDLFTDGSSFSMNTYSRQFPNRTTLDSGKSLGWSFSVSIEGNGVNTVAKIDLKKT